MKKQHKPNLSKIFTWQVGLQHEGDSDLTFDVAASLGIELIEETICSCFLRGSNIPLRRMAISLRDEWGRAKPRGRGSRRKDGRLRLGGRETCVVWLEGLTLSCVLRLNVASVLGESCTHGTERSALTRHVRSDAALVAGRVASSLLVKSRGKRSWYKRELAGHQSLNKIHSNGEVSRIKSTAILSISKVPTIMSGPAHVTHRTTHHI